MHLFFSNYKAVIFLILAYFAYKALTKSKMPEIRISDWRVYYPEGQFSTQEYYRLVQEILVTREVPKLAFGREIFRQGLMFSGEREYLRVTKAQYVFDICAAPYGKGFFVSWWFGEKFGLVMRILVAIPVVGWIALRLRASTTYYQADTQAMFEKAVECAVNDALKAITEEKGQRTEQAFEAQAN